MLEPTSDENIRLIAKGFMDGTLEAKAFTHAAHISTALYLLRNHGDKTEDLMPDMIRCFNLEKGGSNTDTEGYHHTITLASIRALSAFLAHYNRAEPLSLILQAVLKTRMGDKNWLLEFWSKPVLFSVKARKHWVDPDIAPFPWLAPALHAD